MNTEKRKFGEAHPRAAEVFRHLTDPDRLPLYWLNAVFMTLVIECLARHSIVAGVAFVFDNPLGFLTCAGILLLTLHPAMLCPKRLPLLALINFVWLGLGVTEWVLMFNRITPLTAVDFSLLLSVITIMHVYLTVPQMILCVAAILGAVVLTVVLFIRVPSRPVFWKRAGLSLAGTAVCLAAVVALGFGYGHLSDDFPNLAKAYKEYGFNYCFTMSIVDRGVDKPEEYGPEAITGILNEIGETVSEEGPATPGEAHTPNVILVQLESFFDVHTLQGVTFDRDPTPRFTELCERWPSGHLWVPSLGAGTVNTEFEVLTGMRVNDFGTGEYPYRTVLSAKTCETIAYDLLASGYRTHAVHNHEGTFYARHQVYTHLGFESFTPIESFLHPEYNDNGWAKDAILTDEILYLLQSTPEPDLVFAVSVQAHGKYPTTYEPAEGDARVTGGVDAPETRSKLDYYLAQIEEVDAFVGALYDAVMALEEDTLLVFYGDHLPSFSQDEGLTLTCEDFETPYLIVANYDWGRGAEAAGLAHPGEEGEELYAYQLFSTIMALLGNNEGLINRFHRNLRDSEDYLTYLAALEYDIFYGDGFAYDGASYPVMSDMTVGTREIKITGYEDNGSVITVTGENFTPYSVVALDGDIRKTVYVDEHTLTIKKGLSTDRAKTVTVRQCTGKAEVLRETEPYPISRDGK